jgi:hypothetical protein
MKEVRKKRRGGLAVLYGKLYTEVNKRKMILRRNSREKIRKVIKCLNIIRKENPDGLIRDQGS